MERTRAYRRYQRQRAIRRKKGVSRRIYGIDWFQGVDGKYSKGHIGCGCGLCKPDKRFRRPSLAEARKSKKYIWDIAEFMNRDLRTVQVMETEISYGRHMIP